MKILIILFCLVLLFRDKKEGWKIGKAFKRAGSGIKKVATNVAKVIVDPMIAIRAAEALLRKAEEWRRKQQECLNKQFKFDSVTRERSNWSKQLSNLKNPPSYQDKNFNNVFSNYYRNDLIALNNYIDENTQLNNTLNGALKRIKIVQTNNKRLFDLLNAENKKLKECKINKELTDNDYEVLS